jgi:cytochrome P450
VRTVSKLHPDPAAIGFISKLRRKHGTDYIYVSLLGKKSLLVTDVEGLRHVLEHSPYVYADPRAKRLGMGHFMPDAVTISRGEEWRERRRFVEDVLAYHELHPMAGTFLKLVDKEVHASSRGRDGAVGWADFSDLFERVSLGVIFGPSALPAASRMSDQLTQMMKEANRIFGLSESAHFKPFYKEMRDQLAAPAEGSLLTRCPHAHGGAQTSPESQVPHWMFAMRDTLAANALHTLALISSHPSVEERVRAELASADLGTPEGVDGLRYLHACLDETMRLWPTTAMLVREALVDDTLNGERVEAGSQVIIHNAFNHRNPDVVEDPDRFVPDRWLPARVDYRFNHMSNGTQSCAGRSLALFIGKAALAGVLREGRYRVKSPALAADRPIPQVIDTYRVELERA